MIQPKGKVLRSDVLKKAYISLSEPKELDMPFMNDVDIPEEAILRCEDCGRPYGDPGWIDCVLPDDQWLMIHTEASPRGYPPEGGILCGACMIKRAEKLPHACAVRMCIDFGDSPIALVDEDSPKDG